MSRRHRAQETGVQLFPFLDVLLSTMGALILLLALASRNLSKQEAELSVDAPTLEEISVRREMVDWEIEQLIQQRDKTIGDLADQRRQLGHLENHARQLRAELDEMAKADALLSRPPDTSAREQKEAELRELRSRLTAAKRDLDAMLSEQANAAPAYAVVPYQGPNETRRRPIYIECRAEEVVLQPEGVVLTSRDFDGPMGPGNPLAAAVRAAREHITRLRHSSAGDIGEPYPLLLVRPEGIESFYAARAALASWGSEFGYEFIESDWKISYLSADASLATAEQDAVDNARQQQLLVAQFAPRVNRSATARTYRASKSGGGVVAEDGGESPRPRRNFGGGGSGGPRGGFATNRGEQRGGYGNSENGSPSGQGYGSGAGGAGEGYGSGGDGTGEDGDFGTGDNAGGRYGNSAGGALAGGSDAGGGGNSYQSALESAKAQRAALAAAGGSPLAGPLGAGGAGGSSSLYREGAGAANGGGTGYGNAVGTPAGESGSTAGNLAAGPGGSVNPNGAHGAGTAAGGSSSGANGAAGGGQAGSPSDGPALADAGGGAAGGSPGNGGAGNSANGGSAGGQQPPGIVGLPGSGPSGFESPTGGPSGGQPQPGLGAQFGQSSQNQNGAPSAAGSNNAQSAQRSRQAGGPSSPFDSAGKPKGRYESSSSGRSGGPMYGKRPSHRGQNWALPESGHSSVPLTRPIRVQCREDRITVIAERGARNPSRVIELGPQTEDSIDDFVSAIWAHMEDWGIAGDGFYWRPVVKLETIGAGSERAAQLKAALADSGLEIRDPVAAADPIRRAMAPPAIQRR